MKKIITMKTVIKFLTGLCLFAILACENPLEQPFRAGLGLVEDTQNPTVSLESPNPKDKYIFGIQQFRGSAEDDYKLSRVEFWVTDSGGFKDVKTEEEKEQQKKWDKYDSTDLRLSGQNKGRWTNSLDTRLYYDGPIKIRLRVWDSYNKNTQTDEISFWIKNEPTLITLSAPSIAPGYGVGEVGGRKLNDWKGDDDTGSPITEEQLVKGGTNYKLKVRKNGAITGTLKHDQGIYTGSESGGNFPPQIRRWRIKDDQFDTDPNHYAHGSPPDTNKVRWYTLDKTKGELTGITQGDYLFNYPFTKEDETGHYYGFEIRAQNTDGRSRVHYPRSYYPDVTDEDWKDTSKEYKYYSYVLVYYSPDNETPVVINYNLDDVNAYWSNPASYDPFPQITTYPNTAHPYVDAATVNKNGDFILRIRAKHSEGIVAAEVYWENKDTKQRGRFIWDFEPDPDYSTMPQQPFSKLKSDWDLDVTKPYNQWGYKEPYAPYTSPGQSSRSFFFHYRHKGHTIHVGPTTVNQVWKDSPDRQISQVQVFNGTDDDANKLWDGKKENTDFAKDNSSGRWSNLNTLPDGNYKLEIYARQSDTSTVSRSLLDITIKLDTTAPTVTLDKISKMEGEYQKKSDVTTHNEYLVNGVIKPMLTFNDPGNGSGLRQAVGTLYFSGGFEQFFMLIKNSSKLALDAFLNDPAHKNWWPIEATTMPADLLTVNGIPITANGKVSNNEFKIKTSPIYLPAEANTLDDSPDGEPYWVYVFCRDQAFNVGRAQKPFALDVKKDSDIPKLDFNSGAIKKVTDPNNDGNENSFVYGGETRNKLAPGSAIRLTITDDDSLDLGTSGTAPADNSGVSVHFTRSKYDGEQIVADADIVNAKDIKPDTGNAVTLGQDQIKRIFGVQPGSGADRKAVFSKLGVIGQDELLTAIRNTPGKAGIYGVGPDTLNLPDGMYYFTISISDYRPLKMRMDTPTDTPVVATASESFWIVVDTVPPEYKIFTPEEDPLSAQPDEYIPKGKNIRGTVEDANGPVVIIEDGCKVYNKDGEPVSSIIFTKTADPIRDLTEHNKWKGEFSTTLDMGTQTGRFRFEITFRDRFGLTSKLVQYLQVDSDPPKAVINTPITTFKRDYEDADTGLTNTALGATEEARSVNRNRLANGVLNFTISASDNVKLESVKWWLVSGDKPGAPTAIQYNEKGPSYTYVSVRSGTLTLDFTAMRFIDSSSIPDGVYTLYVMAKDTAGNISDINANPKSTQVIYLLKDHDRPYFYPDTTGGGKLITPDSGTVVGTPAIVTGEITDDDGFFDADNKVINGSVRIWMSDSASAGSVNLANEPEGQFGFGPPKVYGTANFTTGLTRARNGVMSVNVNLENLFGTASGPLSTDGPKYYIIEATDSNQDKYGYTSESSGTKPDPVPANRQIRRKLFSFIYDTKPPVISLSYPDTNPATRVLKTFGPNADDNDAEYNNFHLTGTLSDANLARTEGGFYYFFYYVDSNTRETYILASSEITKTEVIGGDTIVSFTVKASDFCRSLNFNAISEGATHTLTLVARDKSGKEGTCNFNFIKDKTPPVMTFTDPADTSKRQLPRLTFDSSLRDWWTYSPPGGQEQNWYKTKRTWLETTTGTGTNTVKVNALPIIEHNGIPRLKVTFNDETSTIVPDSLKYWIDGASGELNARTLTVPPSNTITASKSVSYTINLTTIEGGSVALADGIHSIRFEIQDSVGNVLLSNDSGGNPIYWGFRINSKPPTIKDSPTAPPANGKVYGTVTSIDTAAYFAMNVTAKGANLQNARLRIKYPGGAWSAITTLEPTANNGNWFYDAANNLETLTWSPYNITRAMLRGSAANPPEGDYELELTAVGLNGDLSDPYLWQFTIDPTPPSVEINGFPEAAKKPEGTAVAPNQWTNASEKKIFTSPSQRIQGLIKDGLSSLKNAQILIQRYNYTTGAWSDYYDGSGGDPWVTGEYWNELIGGGETTKEKIVDWTLESITGMSDGFYRARLRARDSAYINGSTAWTPNTVDGHPTYSNYYYFFYAPTAPSITRFEDDDRTLFSAAVSAGTLTFKGVAESKNGYKNIAVTIQRSGQADRTIQIPTTGFPFTGPPWSNNWNWTAPLTGFSTADNDTANGSYKLTFTVTDLAEQWSSSSRTITLDNHPPTVNVAAPELLPDDRKKPTVNNNRIYEFASETFYGGEDAVIKGTAEDTNGLAGIWYHLGYTGYVPAQGNVVAPTRTQVIQTVLGTTVTDDKGGDANNALFDAEAKKTGPTSSAWFKYTNEAGYPKPDLVDDLGTVSDFFQYPGYPSLDELMLYDWELKIPYQKNLSRYTKDGITVKGRTYNGGATIRTMAHRVNEDLLKKNDDPNAPPLYDLSAYKKNGLYSIPLWIRVADKAGNVFYFQQDIWVYPNGDYPANAINNPAQDIVGQGTNNGSVKGGTITVEGIASDNVNIKSVIFRVRADNKPSTNNLNDSWAKDPPNIAQVIHPASGAVPFTGSPGQEAQWNVFTGGGSPPQGTTITDRTGWYLATVEGADALLKSKPWNFYINANNEFTTEWVMPDGPLKGTVVNPIRDWGFANTIRVYVEILVFDGGGTGQDYHFMSLGSNNSTTNATPDVRIFYLSSTAPQITTTQLSDVNVISNNVTAIPGATISSNNGFYSEYKSGRTRSNRFAVRMFLNGNGKNIRRVSVSLPEEARGGGGDATLAQWLDVWNSTDRSLQRPGVKFASATTPQTIIGNNQGPAAAVQSFYMYYGFDTAITTASDNAAFAPVMKGNWKESGGKYTIDVRLYDTSEAVTSFRFEIGIDNFAPVADEDKVVTNSKVAGSNQTFMGRAYDYYGLNSNAQPGYYSVEKVYAWFTKNVNGETRYVNMSNNTTSPMGAVNKANRRAYVGRRAAFTFNPTSSDTVSRIDLSATGDIGDCAYPAPGGPVTTNGIFRQEISTDYVKVISESEAAILTNNMYWSAITAGRSIQWSFILDTTKLPDGPIELNYIVVDGAGNASQYKQTMVVMNNYPRIIDLTLYTDNTGQGAVFTTHDGNEASSDYKVPDSMPDGYLNSGFIAKNKYIGFKVQTSSGNPPLNYRVQYVKRFEVDLTQANLAKMANGWGAPTTAGAAPLNVYTIASKGTMGDPIWATLMDRPKVNAKEGMHFEFKATAEAVADMTQYGTGTNKTTVYRYEQISTLSKALYDQGSTVDDRPDGNAAVRPFRFADGDFGSTANSQIIEANGSHPPEEGGSGNSPANTAFFLIKVWDTVNGKKPGDGGYNEGDMLYDILVVGMNVYLSDNNPPTARLYDLNPYTEVAVTGNNVGSANKETTIRNAADPIAVGSNIIRGGLFNNNIESDLVKSGYIEPRNGSYALRPRNSDGTLVYDSDYPLKNPDDDVTTGGGSVDKVSGRIILRGVAWDDQLIDRIQIQIGSGSSNTILQLNQTTGKMEAQPPYQNSAFAAETLHWKTGHTVEWAYVWDTEQEPAAGRPGGGPITGVPIQVTVIDKGSHNSISVDRSGDTNVTPFHNKVNVDIVPYIIGFERETPTFATKRSLQGWYSFYQGEANIALLGYNFGQTPGAVQIYLASTAVAGAGNGTDITTMGGSVAYNGGKDNTKNRFYFTIPATAQSGRLQVTVSGSNPAWNHSSSHAKKSWNRESNSYTPGSDLWINKPYAHIWRSTLPDADTSAPRTYIGTLTGSSGLDHPGMALEYTGTGAGTLHGTWSVYGRANSFYGTNNGTSNALGYGNPLPGEPFGTPDISIYNGGGAAAANIGYALQNDGRPLLRVRAYVTAQGSNNADDASNGNTIQAYIVNGSTQRWQNIRVSKQLANTTTGTETNSPVGRLYMTAFNADTKGLWYGVRDNAANPANATMFIDGGRMGNDAGLPSITAAGQGAAASAGQYSAIDYDNVGPIIAYYDQTNDTVRIAFGANYNPTAANSQWTRRYLLPTTGMGSQLRRGSGKYISMKVDKANGIHIAFYNSVYNTVVYYYAKNRAVINSANTPVHNGDTVKIHTIDNVVTGGTWTDISVDDNGNPWIVYGDSSRTGNKDGARIAYLSSDAAGYLSGGGTGVKFAGELTCPVTGADIKGWEALTMPANYTVNSDRLNIEAWPPTLRGGTLGNAPGWNAAIGYASDMYRVGYFYYPAWKGY